MKIPEILSQFPDWANKGLGEIHFADFYKLTLKNDPKFTVDFLTQQCLSFNPFWLRCLMHTRNAIVCIVGWKAGTTNSGTPTEMSYYEKGDTLKCFHVQERVSDMIVIGEDDRGLNFRILTWVVINEVSNELEFRFSTLVHTNNSQGKFYFAMVKPFHQIIMRRSFKQLRKLSTLQTALQERFDESL